jgi:TRAP-type C4-dicarboxylate transport system permease small subunit
MSLIKRFNSFFDKLLSLMAIVAGGLLAFSLLSVSFAVASRYFFNYPIGWVIEISSYILLYVTFLVGAWVLKGGGHVTIDIILSQLQSRTQSLINFVTSIINAAVCLILTYYAGKVTLDLYQTHYFTPTELELPKWTINIIIVIGSLSLFFQFIRSGVGYMGKFREVKKQSFVPETLKEYEP